jgi:hypothetical protein
MLPLFHFILLFLIFFILFFIINKNMNKNILKEHYLTYFLPFYDDNINQLTNFYANDEYNNNSFKSKFNYDTIYFSCIPSDVYFIKLLISHFISNSFIYKASYIIYKDLEKSIDDLVSNKLNFSINTETTLIHYSNVNKKNISSLRFISNLYKLYIYCFTLKDNKIYSLNDIPTNTIIGIVNKPDPFYLYYEKFFIDLGYKEPFKIKFYNSQNDLFKGLLNNECNLIVLTDIFPSTSINDILTNNPSEFIILLPFDIMNEDLFLKKNNFLHIDYIDLNKISKSFLPKSFGNYKYHYFKPNLKISYMYKILISNHETPDDYTYKLCKFLFENYKKINKNNVDFGYYLNVQPTQNKLEYHGGVLKYMKEYGYITNINNVNCPYLIGVDKCTKKTLENNNLYL